jgi:hypothetical protein
MKVAFGSVSITPPEFLGGYVGRPMAGYTPIPTCTAKFDDIHAYGVLIETTILGNIPKYLLLISMDILQIPLMLSTYFKEKIQDRFKIHPNQILIHATHTHKSFDMTGTFSKGGNWPGLLKGIITGASKKDDKYKVWIARQLVRMVDEMLSRLVPARIAWKKIIPEPPVSVNRRRHEISNQPFGVIAFKELNSDRLIGFIMNFGAHPTTLSHTNHEMSADYPGRAVAIVEKKTNNEVKTAWFTGPAGDVAPYYGTGGYRFYKKNMKGVFRRTQLYTFTRYYGSFLGTLGLNYARAIPDQEYFTDLSFHAYVKVFWVPMKDYKKYRLGGKRFWVYPNNRIVHIAKRYILFPLALAMGEAREPNFPGFAAKHRKGKSLYFSPVNAYTQIQYLQLDAFNNNPKGNNNKLSEKFSIVGVPGELFEIIAQKIYTHSPTGPNNTLIFQAANDWIAYLFPLKDYIQEGGYEPLASFAPMCGAYVYMNLLRLWEEMAIGIHAGSY